MPQKLINMSMSAPGFRGLNRQQGNSILDPSWALIALNCVIDDVGRIGSRQGTKDSFNSVISNSPSPRQIHEYIDKTGATLRIFSAGLKIYKDTGSGTPTIISASMTTATADNWKFVNFNGKCVGVQEGHAPIVMDTIADTSFEDISASGDIGTPNEIVVAGGRIWMLQGQYLAYSAILDETAWPTLSPGEHALVAGAGFVDLKLVWLTGMDVGVALAEFNDHLVIFGKKSIVVYQDPWDPAGSSFQLVENITGVGCIARDTVVGVAGDLVFLSSTGVRTLSRTIQEKSMPLSDLSKNNKDYVLQSVNGTLKANIKAVYHEKNGFYLLSLPDQSKTFVFDMRGLLEDGSAKVTEWDVAPTAMMSSLDTKLYFGAPGQVQTYEGYQDNADTSSTTGSTYTMHYHTTWTDLGKEASQYLKIPKRLSMNLFGGQGQTATLHWAFDFSSTLQSASVGIPVSSGAEWGEAEWGSDEFSGGLVYASIDTPMNRNGQVLQVGIQIPVSGEQIAIQRINMLSKIGKQVL